MKQATQTGKLPEATVWVPVYSLLKERAIEETEEREPSPAQTDRWYNDYCYKRISHTHPKLICFGHGKKRDTDDEIVRTIKLK